MACTRGSSISEARSVHADVVCVLCSHLRLVLLPTPMGPLLFFALMCKTMVYFYFSHTRFHHSLSPPLHLASIRSHTLYPFHCATCLCCRLVDLRFVPVVWSVTCVLWKRSRSLSLNLFFPVQHTFHVCNSCYTHSPCSATRISHHCNPLVSPRCVSFHGTFLWRICVDVHTVVCRC